jgi:hypothetical protein
VFQKIHFLPETENTWTPKAYKEIMTPAGEIDLSKASIYPHETPNMDPLK